MDASFAERLLFAVAHRPVDFINLGAARQPSRAARTVDTVRRLHSAVERDERRAIAV